MDDNGELHHSRDVTFDENSFAGINILAAAGNDTVDKMEDPFLPKGDKVVFAELINPSSPAITKQKAVSFKLPHRTLPRKNSKLRTNSETRTGRSATRENR